MQVESTKKELSVKQTVEYIQLVINKKLKKDELEKIKEWLERQYDMAENDGIIKTLQRNLK